MKKAMITERVTGGWVVEDVYEPAEMQPGIQVTTVISDANWMGMVQVGKTCVPAGTDHVGRPLFRAA